MRKWTITLTLSDECCENKYVVATSADHIVSFGERFVDDLKAGFLVPVANSSPFEQTVEILKERKFRKDLLERISSNLGLMLAEHMEDSEGWHGEDRRERIKHKKFVG